MRKHKTTHSDTKQAPKRKQELFRGLPGVFRHEGAGDPAGYVLAALNEKPLKPLRTGLDPEETERFHRFFEMAREVHMEGPRRPEELSPQVSMKEWIKELDSLTIKPTFLIHGEIMWESAGSDRSDLEIQARLAVFSVAQQGRLSSLQQCACGCGVWLLPAKVDHRYASTNCRVKHNQQKPEIRNARKNGARDSYMRELLKDDKKTGGNRAARLAAFRQKRGTL